MWISSDVVIFMRKSCRSKVSSFDFKIYHSRGKKVYKNRSNSQEMGPKGPKGAGSGSNSADDTAHAADTADADAITEERFRRIEESTLRDEINDFFDENLIEDICDSEHDLGVVINRVDELRCSYREKEKHLRILLGDNYDGSDICLDTIRSMKDYILYAKKSKKNLKKIDSEEKMKENVRKAETFNFLPT